MVRIQALTYRLTFEVSGSAFGGWDGLSSAPINHPAPMHYPPAASRHSGLEESPWWIAEPQSSGMRPDQTTQPGSTVLYAPTKSQTERMYAGVG